VADFLTGNTQEKLNICLLNRNCIIAVNLGASVLCSLALPLAGCAELKMLQII